MGTYAMVGTCLVLYGNSEFINLIDEIPLNDIVMDISN